MLKFSWGVGAKLKRQNELAGSSCLGLGRAYLRAKWSIQRRHLPKNLCFSLVQRRWKERPWCSLVFMVFAHGCKATSSFVRHWTNRVVLQPCPHSTTVGRNRGRRPSLFRQNLPHRRMGREEKFPHSSNLTALLLLHLLSSQTEWCVTKMRFQIKRKKVV